MSYIQNLSAKQQLAEISNYAHSSSGSIAGNIGMIGGHVVKFNTHWNERLLSRTTQDMLNASNQMRDTLKGLIGQLVADEGKRTELMDLIDKGGTQTLLERSVVAKVIDSIDEQAQTADLSRYSSSGRDTGFATVQHAVELRDQQYKASLIEVRGEVQSVQNRFKGKMKESQMARFNDLTELFLREASSMKQRGDGSNKVEESLRLKNQKTAIRVLSRLAMDGSAFPIDKRNSDELVEMPANDTVVDCWLKFAVKHEQLAVKLLAYCEVKTVNDIFGQMDEEQLKKLEDGVLSRSVVYEAAVGTPVPEGVDVDALSSAGFRDLVDSDILNARDKMLEEFKMADIANGADEVKVENDYGVKGPLFTSFVSGSSGLVFPQEVVVNRLVHPGPEGAKVTLADAKVVSSAYNVEKAKAEGLDGMKTQLGKDFRRGSKIVKMFGQSFDIIDSTNYKEKLDGIIKLLEEKCGNDENKKLVTGLAMTQGGLAGFGGVGTNLGWLNYDLEETSDGSFKLTVDNKCEPNRTTEIGLTITIGANGENQITGFEVTIAPKTPN